MVVTLGGLAGGAMNEPVATKVNAVDVKVATACEPATADENEEARGTERGERRKKKRK